MTFDPAGVLVEANLTAAAMFGCPRAEVVGELRQDRPMIVGVAKPSLKGPLAHFEVVIGVERTGEHVATIDPALGVRQNSIRGLLDEWVAAGQVPIVVVPHDGVAGPRVARASVD